MKHLFFIFSALFASIAGNAQVFSKQLKFNNLGHTQRNWYYLWADATIIEKSNQQGYLIAHNDESDSLYRQPFGKATIAVGLITNLNKNSDVQWTKMYRYNNYTRIQNLVPTNNQNYIAQFQTNENTGPWYWINQPNIFAKIDSSGTILWSKKFGFDSNSNILYLTQTLRPLKQAANTDILITAQADDSIIRPNLTYPIQRSQIACVRLSENGTKIWAKKIVLPDYNMKCYNIVETAEHDILIFGRMSDTIYGSGKDYPYLLKLTENGEILWLKKYNNNFFPENLSIANSGTIIMNAYSTVYRFDKNGIPLPHTIPNATPQYYLTTSLYRNDSIISISETNNENVKILMIKDTLGNILHQKGFYADRLNVSSSISNTSDNGIIATSYSLFGRTEKTWHIQKFNAQFETNCPSIDSVCNTFAPVPPITYEDVLSVQTTDIDVYDAQGESLPYAMHTENYCAPPVSRPSPNFALASPVCVGDSVRISGLQNANSDTYRWDLQGSVADSSLAANPNPVFYNTPGRFPITQTVSFVGCPQSFTDTVVVVEGITRDFLRDTTFCMPTPVTFSLPSGYTYLWENGATNPIRTVAAARIYTLKINDGLCSATDTAQVRFVSETIPPILARHDTSFCAAQSVLLDAINPLFSNYLWSSGATTPSISVAQSGTYSVTVTVENCAFSDTVRVREIVAPQPILPYSDTTICDNSVKISAQNPAFQSYLWSNGSRSPNINISTTGVYTVTASIGVCAFTDKVVVKENSSCRANIYIPNIFTPNGDGYNEEWQPFGKNIRITHLQIFDRRGELVFESEAENPKWDGTFKEKPMVSAVFVYQIWYTNTLTNERFRLAGDVTLQR